MDLSALSGALGGLQERLRQQGEAQAKDRIDGSAGGGAVTIRLRGDLQVDQVRIAPAAAAAVANDAGMLEDLIAAAVGDALRRWRDRYGATAEEQAGKAMGGLGGLGGLDQLGGLSDLLGGARP